MIKRDRRIYPWLVVWFLYPFFFIAGCGRVNETPRAEAGNVKEYIVSAVLFQRESGEYRALAYQAFNLAALRLDVVLKGRKANDTVAIVCDLDETLLDNSAYFTHLINKNSDDSSMYEWRSVWAGKELADSIPGSVSFLRNADSRGVKIFYVSNRLGETEATHTIDNMRKLGFPQLIPSTFYFRDTTNEKRYRFDAIQRRYPVVLWLGDNLNDFSGSFYRRPVKDRKFLADSLRNRFGFDYIVLPNPVYGDWEQALYNYQKLSREQKRLLRDSLLRMRSY